MPIRRTSNRSSYDSGFYNPEVYSDVGSRRIFEFDSNALAYINAVEAADGQALEFNVKVAYNTFVVGCKSDGIWDAIKASCIMAGARTLSGALVPLVGVAPSGFNLASGTYSRTVGLTGNIASSMYLDSNRAANADPQNNAHMAFYQVFGNYFFLMGDRSSVTGASYIDTFAGGLRARARINTSTDDKTVTRGPGIVSYSRTGSTTGTIRGFGQSYSITTTSQTPQSETILLYARRNATTGAPESYQQGTVCFYSIGESLNLSALDSRVEKLVNDIAFYINTGLDSADYDIDTLKYVNQGYAAGGSLS